MNLYCSISARWQSEPIDQCVIPTTNYPQLPTVPLSQIDPDLYVGDIDSIRSADLTELNIDRVVSVCKEPIGESITPTHDIFPIADWRHDHDIFANAVDAILDAWEDGETVAVHCQYGQSRSVSAAAAALATKNQLGVANAYERIGEEHGIAPSPHLKESAVKYVDTALN